MNSMMKRAKSEGLKVFAEFATLNGKHYVENILRHGLLTKMETK